MSRTNVGLILLRPLRWSAAARLAAVGALIVATAIALTASLVVRQVEMAMVDRAQNSLETNLRLARELLLVGGGDGPPHVEGERLVAANGRVLDGDMQAVDKVREIAGGTATIFRGDLRVSTNVLKADGSRAVGTRLAPGPAYDAVFGTGLAYRGQADILGIAYFTVYEPLKDAEGRVVGILYVGVKKTEFLAPVVTVKHIAAIGGVVLALLGGGAVFLVVRRAFRPLLALRGAMGELAAGNFGTAIPAQGRGDEIGAMAEAVQVFKDAAVEKFRLEEAADEQRRATETERAQREAERAAAAEAASLVVESIGAGLERLSEGDLTCRLNETFQPAYEKLRADFNAAMNQLQGAIRAIIANAQGIRMNTGEISQAADDLSRRTEQQAASLEETAAALDEITATVRRMADGAMQARDLVSKTRAEAERSGQVVREAVSAMSEIERSSQQIGQIIGVINEIAFQTNLLALNAGVEAARAGEAGRGFAVVASEVRALAQRSADAAREIKTLISASAQQVGSGVKLVGGAGQALASIAAQVGEIDGVVREIASSAQEQATGLVEVNTAVNQMDQVTQQNAAMVEQSTAASHSLAQETEKLARLTGRFQLGQEDGDAEPASNIAPLRRPARTPAPRPRAATVQAVSRGRNGAAARTLKPATDEQNWEEF